MSKHLKTIQGFAKAGKIIAKILSIFCIIGIVGCAIGFLALVGIRAIIPDGSNIFGSLLAFGIDFSLSYAIIGCIFGMIACAGEFVLCRYAVKYFENELAAGTPFTYDGAKEILRLGILSIVIPLAISILEGIVFGIFLLFFPAIADMDINNSSSIGTGIMLILASFIFKYGADIIEEKNALEAEKANATATEAQEQTTE